MNIVFNKCIFTYLCLFDSLKKYFYEFQSVFVNFCFIDIIIKIFTDILLIFSIYLQNQSINISRDEKNKGEVYTFNIVVYKSIWIH